MAITVDWDTRVINVPQANLTLVSGDQYELDINSFRLTLRSLEASEEGIVFPTTHNHNTSVLLGNLTLARVVEIINSYTVTFENLQYAVDLFGANHNVLDVTNRNQVSVSTQNSAGLIELGSGLDATQAQALTDILRILRGDMSKTGTRVQILEEGTSTVLVDKDETKDCDAGTYSLTQHV